MGTNDVILVGRGMAGLVTAYHLTRLGTLTQLLKAGDLGEGTLDGSLESNPSAPSSGRDGPEAVRQPWS